MDEHASPESRLTIIDVVDNDEHRHLVCLIDPELAQERGIDASAIVGKFDPDPDGEFDVSTFVLNTEFLEALTRYMNEVTSQQPLMVAEAARNVGGNVYLLDPRASQAQGAEIDARDVLGGFSVDETGAIVPGSFNYNEHHRWFDPELGQSGVFSDSRFYDWLHFTDPADEEEES